MRFAFAAAILVQVLPSALTLEGTDTKTIVQPFTTAVQSSRHQKNSGAVLKDGHVLMDGKRNRPQKRTGARVRNHQGRYDECDPDIGLLGCGVGMYCQPDNESILGGHCSALNTNGHHRKLYSYSIVEILESFCGGDLCDCEQWDLDSHAGKMYCSLNYHFSCNFCEDGYNFCPDNESNDLTSDGASWTITKCAFFSAPYEQTFCASLSGATAATDCAITVDDIPCTYCEYLQDSWVRYDCQNVGMAHSASSLDFLLAPIASKACGEDEGPCTMCPSGLADPDAQHYFQGYGYMSCQELQTYMDSASINTNDCYNNVYLEVQDKCCGTTRYYCFHCGEDGTYIIEPETAVFEKAIDMTCGSALYLLSLSGEYCLMIPGSLNGTCSCDDGGTTIIPTEHPESFSPTESPTTSPTIGSPATAKITFDALAIVGVHIVILSSVLFVG